MAAEATTAGINHGARRPLHTHAVQVRRKRQGPKPAFQWGGSGKEGLRIFGGDLSRQAGPRRRSHGRRMCYWFPYGLATGGGFPYVLATGGPVLLGVLFGNPVPMTPIPAALR